MSADENGGPAFPHVHEVQANGPGERSFHVDYGMTLRDYFAGQALTGGVAFHQEDGCPRDPVEAAERAYEYADAMLVERSKR